MTKNKWQEAEQRAEQLEQWKKEAQALLTPIFDWGQKELPLGTCSTTEALRRAKEYNGLKEKAERYEKALKEIWSLIPAKHEMIAIAREALTPKTTNDE